MSSLSFGRLATLVVYTLLASTAAGLPSSRPPVSARDAAFTRLGCFTDGTSRALSGDSKADDAMTVDMCASYCSSYQYFGVEYGRECYCGNDRHVSSVAAPDADCSFPCAGDATEMCGAGVRLDVYTNNNHVIPAPATSAGAPYLGCFVDNAARALPKNIVSQDGMTAAKCAANCAGFAYFGTQWSRECYCGNTRPEEQAAESDCNMPCDGDATEMCGAGMRLSVYGPVDTAPTEPPAGSSNPSTVDDFTYEGCYTDSIALRVLSGSTTTTNDNTLASCAATCAGYNYFGVEYGTQCFCGMDLDPSGVKLAETECAMKCGGDESLLCGDANRLSVYKRTASDAPFNPKTVGAFTYQSCWTDGVGTRSLAAKSEVLADMTVEICAAFCDGYAYFGVEYSTECYCSNELAGESAAEADCSMLCGGSASQWCGGPNRLNLYAVTPGSPASSTVEPTPTITPSPELTTVTSCSLGLVGGTTTSCFYQLPSPCRAMSSSMAGFIGSMSADMCSHLLGIPLPTNIKTCFPSPYFKPTDTASTIYSCLQTAALCSYATGCATATYTVGQEPTAATAASTAPASSTGALTNAGFESGDMTGWTLNVRGTPFTSENANPALSHSGDSAFRAVFQNDNGKNSEIKQTASVVPGGNYTLSMWVRDENQLVDCGVYLMASPYLGTSNPYLYQSFKAIAPNVWNQMSVGFQAAASFVTVTINYYCNGYGGGKGLVAGYNNLYFDDVFLVRTDVV
ncbi:WSC domain-containing protein [Parachaetomium inaequale]|uniref:WSC domain-containing protein n=1 Tax=Parachaetomium inaequale TaxID=2588326 RepID=A0AAN6P8N1_9PEZI|nr:WSC domain-containing protein [Parachaetomium inaequale]